MKLKSLISLFTVTVVLVTSVVSFATWDQLSDTKSTTFTVAQGVTTTLTLPTNAFSDAIGDTVQGKQAINGTFTVGVANIKADSNLQLKLVPTIKDGGTAVTAGAFDVKFKKSSEDGTAWKSAADFTGTGLTDSNSFDVQISGVTGKEAELEALAGKTLTLELEATIAEPTA